LLALAATPGLVFLFPELFHLHGQLRVEAMVLVVLSGVDLAIGIPANTFGATLIGFQRYDLVNAISLGTAVARAAAWTAILAAGGGLIAIGAAAIALNILAETASYLLVRRHVGDRPIKRRNFDRALIRPILGMSGWIAVADFGVLLIARLDLIIVGLIAGAAQAGVYAVGAKLASLSNEFTAPAVSVFLPHASDLSASDDRESMRETLYVGTRIAVAIATPLTVVLAVLAKPALHAWVGRGFEDAGLVVVYLSVSVLLASMTMTGGAILRGMGDVKVPALIRLFEGTVNVGLSVALGLKMGMIGVALATLISTAVAQVLRLPYFCRRLQASLVSLSVAAGRGTVIAGLLALGVGFLCRGFSLDDTAEVFAAGCATIATYALIMVPLGLSREERRGLLGFVARQLGGEPAQG